MKEKDMIKESCKKLDIRKGERKEEGNFMKADAKRRKSDEILIGKQIIGSDGYEEKRVLKDDLLITDLEQACLEQSILFSWWAISSALAKSEAARSDERLESKKSSLFLKYKKQFGENSKVTITEIEHNIKNDPEYREIVKDSLNKKYISDLFKVAVDAFSHRKDMLVTISANTRTELSSGIRMANKELIDKTEKKMSKKERKGGDE